jgi:hypothetical protein
VFFFSGAFFFAAPTLPTATNSASAMVMIFFIFVSIFDIVIYLFP